MRVINVHTGRFEEIDPLRTPYAILSHTWDRDGEQTYQEVREIQKSYDKDGRPLPSSVSPPSGSAAAPNQPDAPSSVSSPDDAPARPSQAHSPQPQYPIWSDERLSQKVRNACELARREGHKYLWIDSCCIDKTSSSELSEAINSMYKWYACATVCYAFLADVPAKEHRRAKGSRFRKSRWFRRGWTLQELIAPFNVVFFSQDWKLIGSMRDLVDLVAEITRISSDALLHERTLDEFNVAQRLSWAARRQTTREEDRAYSLLGIFDINMPTLYGEGNRAFRRLQEEIVRRIPDRSIFSWRDTYLGAEILQELPNCGLEQDSQSIQYRVYRWDTQSLLAPQPSTFEDCGSITQVSRHADATDQHRPSLLPAIEYTSTPYGLRTKVAVIPLSSYLPPNSTIYIRGRASEWYLAILDCEHKDRPGHLLGRVCHIPASNSGIERLYPGYVTIFPKPESGSSRPHLFPLSPSTIERCRSQTVVKTLYISHPDRTDWTVVAACQHPHKTIVLVLEPKTRDALLARGYTTVSLRGPDPDHPTTHWLTLSKAEHTIVVVVQHTLKRDGQELAIEAHVQMSEPLLRSGEHHQGDSKPVTWANDVTSWNWGVNIWKDDIHTQTITLTTSSAETTVLVALGFKLAGMSTYSIIVDVRADNTTGAATPPDVETPEGGERNDSVGNRDGRVAEDENREDGLERTGDRDARLGAVEPLGPVGESDEPQGEHANDEVSGTSASADAESLCEGGDGKNLTAAAAPPPQGGERNGSGGKGDGQVAEDENGEGGIECTGHDGAQPVGVDAEDGIAEEPKSEHANREGPDASANAHTGSTWRVALRGWWRRRVRVGLMRRF